MSFFFLFFFSSSHHQWYRSVVAFFRRGCTCRAVAAAAHARLELELELSKFCATRFLVLRSLFSSSIHTRAIFRNSNFHPLQRVKSGLGLYAGC